MKQTKSRGIDASTLVHAAGAAVVCAVALFVYLGMVAPALRDKASQTARAQQAAQDAQDLKAVEEHASALERLSGTLESRLSDTVELRPLEQLNRQVAAVSQLVEEENLHVTKVDPGEAQAFGRAMLVPIRVAGQGTFSDVLAFLHALHEQCKDTEVRAFVVNADPKGATDLVTFELSLAWYAVPSSGIRGAMKPAGPNGSAGGAVATTPENQ
jgi:hypothetical protein